MSDIFTGRLLENVARRDMAMKMCTRCVICESEQVQLVDWLGSKFKYRCRKCLNEWYREPKK